MSSIQKTHKFIKPLDHELFGRIYIYQHYATQNLVIMKEKVANNADHARQEEALIEKRSLMRHPNLMVVKDWSVKSTTKICAEFYAVRAFYSYYLDNAELLAQRRAKQNQPLDDIELMQLVYDGIDVLSYLQTQGYHHGFIRPDMFARDEKGVFVLSDKLLEGTALDAHTYARTMGLDPYCSPLIWDYLVNGASKLKKTNVYKDDAFSFGLVLLRVAILESPASIYERQGHINQSTLSTLIDRASKRYEHLLLFRQLLEKLLMIDENTRMDALALKASMPVREQLQLFFSTDNEDVFFDGPKSQHYNSVLGRESVLPYAVKQNTTKSMYLDNSNLLGSGIHSPSRSKGQFNKPTEDIFAKKQQNQHNYQQILLNGPQGGDNLHETGYNRSSTNPYGPNSEPRGLQPFNQPDGMSNGYRDSAPMGYQQPPMNNPPQNFGGAQGSNMMPNPYQTGRPAPQPANPQPQSNFMRQDYSLEYDLPVGFTDGQPSRPSGPSYQAYSQQPPAQQPTMYRPEYRPPAPQPLSQPPRTMYQPPAPPAQAPQNFPQAYPQAGPAQAGPRPFQPAPAGANPYTPQQASQPQPFAGQPRPVGPGTSGYSNFGSSPQPGPLARTGNTFAPLH